MGDGLGSGHRRRVALAWLVCGALTVVPAWSCYRGALQSHAEIANQWTPGAKGAPSCHRDAFRHAWDMFAEPAIRYVVAGRVASVEGLPDILLDADHEFEVAFAELDDHEMSIATIGGRPVAAIDAADVQVELRFHVRSVLKPPGKCPHPPRVEDAARCERADGLPDELTVRIPTDWFLWPATNTSRRVARRAGGHLAALRELDRKLRAGAIGAVEHKEGRRDLETGMRRDLEVVKVELDGTFCDVRPPVMPPGNSHFRRRLLEDRGGRIAVGGEYLLALRAAEEGVARTSHRPSKLEDERFLDHYVFWGDEARDVETAMMLVGNCMLSKPNWVPQEHLPYACHNYARGVATFWLYPHFQCRH